MENQPTRPSRWRFLLPAGICAALLAIFAGVCLTAVWRQTPTFDETLHAVGGFVLAKHHDFRVNPEDTVLVGYLAALPHRADALKIDTQQSDFVDIVKDVRRHWGYCIRMLYETPGNDGIAFVNRSRAVMVLVSVAIGAVLAWWGGKLAGGVAAVTATVLFSLDPNFLAHGALVKNDTIFTLVFLSLAMAMWRVGRRVTWRNLPALCLLCGLAAVAKYSGVLAGPIMGLLLLIRALMGGEWVFLGRPLKNRPARLAGAAGVGVLAAVCTVAVIWLAYGMHFGPSRDNRAVRFDLNPMRIEAANNAYLARHKTDPSEAELDELTAHPTLTVRAVLFADRHRLLPDTYLAGFLYTHATTMARSSFLCGRRGPQSLAGWWYYFPLAMLFKTPVATIIGGLMAVGAGIAALRRGVLKSPEARWTLTAVAAPPGVYALVAVAGNLNLGLRHMLPVYPFIFLGVSVAMAAAWRARPRGIRALAAALGLLLVAESALAFPHYLSFYNGGVALRAVWQEAPASVDCAELSGVGGLKRQWQWKTWRGGLELLGDSNLDWGQDLPLLAEWQRQHPGKKLYLCYFGTVDPKVLGIQYERAPGMTFDFSREDHGYIADDPPVAVFPERRGLLAISATHLQGIYNNYYHNALWDREPIAVLGGSIYVYEWP